MMRRVGRFAGNALAVAAAVAVGVLLARLIEAGDDALADFDDIPPEAEWQIAAFARSLDYDLPIFLRRWSR